MDSPQRSPESGKRSHGVQSAETVLEILSSFIGTEKSPMLKTISKRTNMHPAKVHRYLVSLVRSGYVEQDKFTNRYGLGAAALRLAFAAINAIDVLRVARPMMAGFCQRVGESLVLAVWNDGGPTIAVKESLPGLLTVTVGEGARLPLLKSSIGAVFGAYMPGERIQPLIDNELAQIQADPGSTFPRTQADVHELFATVQSRGLGRTRGEMNPLTHSFAAPIFDGSGEIVGVLAAVGAAGQFNSEWGSPTAASLLACANEVSRTLGHS